MKKIKEYIFEHFVNLFFFNKDDVKSMMKYSKEVYQLLNESYAYIGGLKGAKTYEEFCENYINNLGKQIFWKMIRRNGKITAIRMYDIKNGRKGIACGTDSSNQGKNDLRKLLEEDYTLSERNVWAENSGKALSVALNSGAMPLTSNIAKELMPDKEITPLEDGYFYKRIVGDKERIKCLIGSPKNKGEKPSQDLIYLIKELGKKYAKQEEDN